MNYWFLYTIATGEIYGSPYLGAVDKWTNIPDGCAVWGPFEEDTASTEVKDAFAHPNYYTVQNGILIAVSNIVDLQLTDAKIVQLAQLNAGFNKTLNGGFTAKTLVGTATSPHTYPSDPTAQSNFTGIVAAFTTNPNKTSTMFYTINEGYVNHTKQEFFDVYSDGDTWKEVQYAQLATLEAQVNAITASTPDWLQAIQAIVWKEVTY